ncbi:hypothetical protein AYL99_05122 [Fonsecaea erecta]|uniref:N-acetyltransferase domain-containing protein n=1 Tax=Fonsecaea erecta TaxID=1367422 RepID=A0A178ZJZ7_9EURO|nr:hypothetical protein AYL99_05122 [Fonsecaea erecta]OAP60120.1 hypothetical protein AYL99_05122 [Fonsecaea erecta]
MRLTAPILLSPADLDTVTPDIASIRHSSLTTTRLGQLRYGAVPHAEARAWLESSTRAELESELTRYPRIVDSLGGRDGLGGGRVMTTSMEHLVVRDLDLESLSPGSPSEGVSVDVVDAAAAAGRVVAFTEFMYHPPPPLPGQEPSSCAETQIDHPFPAPPPPPPSVHRSLHEHWDQTVEAALSAWFGGMHCFEVRGLGTLAPSHLRKGIASTLLAWLLPRADRMGIPVVLAATPIGYPFYLRHGFVEVDGGSRRCHIECDMASWGGSGVHRHVLMIRRPKQKQPETGIV